MKNMIKWFALVLLLVGIIGGATLLYNNLSREYGGENISENEYNEETQNDFMAAPDFTVLDYDLNEVNLSDYMGKPIVLNFWATWCYYCKVEMPDFDKARELSRRTVFNGKCNRRRAGNGRKRKGVYRKRGLWV